MREFGRDLTGETPAAERFADRAAAGRLLARRLAHLKDHDALVVALPRGGVPVAREVAAALGAPLDVFAVRKLGAPHNPEYGIGAVAEDGSSVIDAEAVKVLGIRNGELRRIVAREKDELRRRVAAYREERAAPEVGARTVIVVDDGVATGVTDTAALRALHRQHPRHLVLAVPVCPPESLARLNDEADEIVCLRSPPNFQGVGQWYRDFSQVGDREVIEALRQPADAAA